MYVFDGIVRLFGNDVGIGVGRGDVRESVVYDV